VRPRVAGIDLDRLVEPLDGPAGVVQGDPAEAVVLEPAQ
jgi:hypothetical protein